MSLISSFTSHGAFDGLLGTMFPFFLNADISPLRFPSIIILYILPNKPLPNLQILYFLLWVIMDWALISFLRWNTHYLGKYIMYKCRSNSVVSLTQIYYFLLPNVLPTFLHLIMTFDILPKAGYSFCIWQISTVCSLYVSQQF